MVAKSSSSCQFPFLSCCSRSSRKISFTVSESNLELGRKWDEISYRGIMFMIRLGEGWARVNEERHVLRFGGSKKWFFLLLLLLSSPFLSIFFVAMMMMMVRRMLKSNSKMVVVCFFAPLHPYYSISIIICYQVSPSFLVHTTTTLEPYLNFP